MQCSGKSYWEIFKNNVKYNLLKYFATGKNYESHVVKTNGLSFASGNLTYLEDDMSKSETVIKLSTKKFKITEQSFVNGEKILKENFYEKK
ncbi:hypothetical protein SAMN05421876_10544 [Kaistella jeonii]|uniref:Lipocalin-like domain-containing protein n=1 Tax=Kaistella jeonii TaxID=266749 RepID=A0A0C1FMV4_9FLAO|nr:hypothetical protein OA86_06625 [Kaistella jeonii]SFC01537.1 hypothetical protein SAMN05421876_10544 [Kaistella jeonii]VEI96580.1 Uncharacterised protein [Kaistella jeonii]